MATEQNLNPRVNLDIEKEVGVIRRYHGNIHVYFDPFICI